MSSVEPNHPSKMLTQRLASCRVVLWSLETHGERLKETLLATSRSLSEEAPDLFHEILPRVSGVLRSARDRLVSTDRTLRDQSVVATRFRRQRDAAFEPLYSRLQALRDAMRLAYGERITEDLGFATRVPLQPGVLYEQATHLYDRLSDPELVLPKSNLRGWRLELPESLDELRPMIEDLGRALDAVSREESRVQAAKLAKDEAGKDYDRVFVWGANMAESLFKMADLPEAAKRVRPSSRRRGLTEEVEAEGAEIVDLELGNEGEAPEVEPEAASTGAPEPSEAAPEEPETEP